MTTSNNWPASLRSAARRGSWRWDPGEPPLRTDFETGPARSRRRYTRTVPRIQFSVDFEWHEFEAFKWFFNEGIQQGSLWFNMPVWEGSEYVSREARFVEPYSAQDISLNWTRVSFSVELRELTTLTGGAAWIVGEYGYEFVTDTLATPLDTAVNTSLPTILAGY